MGAIVFAYHFGFSTDLAKVDTYGDGPADGAAGSEGLQDERSGLVVKRLVIVLALFFMGSSSTLAEDAIDYSWQIVSNLTNVNLNCRNISNLPQRVSTSPGAAFLGFARNFLTGDRDFAAFWTGKGYEKGQTQPFWIGLLCVLGSRPSSGSTRTKNDANLEDGWHE